VGTFARWPSKSKGIGMLPVETIESGRSEALDLGEQDLFDLDIVFEEVSSAMPKGIHSTYPEFTCVNSCDCGGISGSSYPCHGQTGHPCRCLI